MWITLYTIRLVNFNGLNFCGWEAKMGLYFCGLVQHISNLIFMDKTTPQNLNPTKVVEYQSSFKAQ